MQARGKRELSVLNVGQNKYQLVLDYCTKILKKDNQPATIPLDYYYSQKAAQKEFSNIVYFCDRPDEYPPKTFGRIKQNEEFYKQKISYKPYSE